MVTWGYMVHKPEDEVKSEQFKLRLTKGEKALLDNIGTPTQWRTFMVVVAMAVDAVKQGTLKKDGKPLEMKDLNLAGAFEQVFGYGPLNKLTESTFSNLLEEYLEGDR